MDFSRSEAPGNTPCLHSPEAPARGSLLGMWVPGWIVAVGGLQAWVHARPWGPQSRSGLLRGATRATPCGNEHLLCARLLAPPVGRPCCPVSERGCGGHTAFPLVLSALHCLATQERWSLLPCPLTSFPTPRRAPHQPALLTFLSPSALPQPPPCHVMAGAAPQEH